jgi:acetyl-CoA acetyltransferase
MGDSSMSSQDRVFVIGVGMTNFVRCDTDVKQLGQSAAKAALADAGMTYDAVEQAFCGYVNGTSTLGQQTLYGIGMTGIPVFNVNNNCSTGSTALYMAWNAIRSGRETSRDGATRR